jgi:hypothetical protein
MLCYNQYAPALCKIGSDIAARVAAAGTAAECEAIVTDQVIAPLTEQSS